MRPAGPEQRRPIAPGQLLTWTLRGPRRCTGVWTGDARTPCPVATPIPATGTDAQCRRCAAADHGRALARDTVTDDREFALYLAWFGPGLVKVGLTAADRGRDRLLEQGALAFTLLATGPHPAVRRAERAVAATGLATERLTARTKAGAWWNLPPQTERASHLTNAYTAIRDAVNGDDRWPAQAAPTECRIIDQAADFGLRQPPPPTYSELAAVKDGATLAGRLTAIIGRSLFLDTATGPLLADMRRIAGWQFTLIPAEGRPHRPLARDASPDASPDLPADLPEPDGLDTTTRHLPRGDHDNQEHLF